LKYLSSRAKGAKFKRELIIDLNRNSKVTTKAAEPDQLASQRNCWGFDPISPALPDHWFPTPPDNQRLL